MTLASFQACMDSSDQWLQGSGNGDIRMFSDNFTSSGDSNINGQKLMAERRLRPPSDQSLKCPRCDSADTKFCYYNNYSLSQPRYFCKTCRRYWTKGGTLRNVPVGGGCRKNKKSSTKKPGTADAFPGQTTSSQRGSAAGHRPSFPGGTPLPPQLNSMLLCHPPDRDFIGSKCDPLLGYPRNFEGNLMEARLGSLSGGSRSCGFMGGAGHGPGQATRQVHDAGYGVTSSCLLGCNPPFGYAMEGSSEGKYMEPDSAGAGERLLLPFGGNGDGGGDDFEMKHTQKELALGWHEQSFSFL